MSDTINITVNSIPVQAQSGDTILQAITKTDYKLYGLSVPVLYYRKDIQEKDESGVCVVEVAGQDDLINAAETEVKEGMEIQTESPKAVAARTEAVQAISDVHDRDCRRCVRGARCEFRELFHYPVHTGKLTEEKRVPVDDRSVIVRDNNRCIRCGRCVNVCKNVQGICAIEMVGTGMDAVVRPVSEKGLEASGCVNCGQCITVCPVGAIYARDDTERIYEAIRDPEKFTVVQVAPAVRAALGEEFDFLTGSNVEMRLAGVLRDLGFDKVFDTRFGADLTIMEEANELLERMSGGGTLPMMTSCCPGWIKYCEQYFPDLLPNISSCKSPHEMFGAVVKSCYAEKLGIDREKIVTVSIMPCSAKKFEITRENECSAGIPDVDIAITTRELARMIRDSGISFEAEEFSAFDDPMGSGTGAGVIFGATGGVMEAALRTAVEKISGEDLPRLEFEAVRGMEGTKEASYEIEGKTIRVAVVSGLANAKQLMEKVRAGEAPYQFIEVMACPGGCINGGGQPHQYSRVWSREDICGERAEVLYEIDDASMIRKSHENPAVQTLYKEYLETPGSGKAHDLLHTSYHERMLS